MPTGLVDTSRRTAEAECHTVMTCDSGDHDKRVSVITVMTCQCDDRDKRVSELWLQV